MYTVHIQISTSGKNKLQGPESKPVNHLDKFGLVEICCSHYCYENLWNIAWNQWISKRHGIQFWPVAPRSTIEGGVCATYAACLYSKAWTRGNNTFDWQEISFCFQAVLHLLDIVSCILKRYGMFYKDKHAILFKTKWCFFIYIFNTVSTQILKAQRGQHSFEKVHH